MFEWEKHQEQELVTLIGSMIINGKNEDQWVWKENDTTEFSVKLAYSILKGKLRGKARCMSHFGGLRPNLHNTCSMTSVGG